MLSDFEKIAKINDILSDEHEKTAVWGAVAKAGLSLLKGPAKSTGKWVMGNKMKTLGGAFTAYDIGSSAAGAAEQAGMSRTINAAMG